MEPTLHDGDILLIRKSDFFPLETSTRHRRFQRRRRIKQGQDNNNNNNNNNDDDDDDDDDEEGKDHHRDYQNHLATVPILTNHKKNNNHQEEEAEEVEWRLRRRMIERRRLLEYEATHCYIHGSPNPSWLMQRPPVPLTGDIVVYQNPHEYPTTWNIKRVIGLGGQVVRTYVIIRVSFPRLIHLYYTHSIHIYIYIILYILSPILFSLFLIRQGCNTTTFSNNNNNNNNILSLYTIGDGTTL